jgi:hypothetical protein
MEGNFCIGVAEYPIYLFVGFCIVNVSGPRPIDTYVNCGRFPTNHFLQERFEEIRAVKSH